MQSVTTIGLDIAKSVFQVHGIDATGNEVRALTAGQFDFGSYAIIRLRVCGA